MYQAQTWDADNLSQPFSTGQSSLGPLAVAWVSILQSILQAAAVHATLLLRVLPIEVNIAGVRLQRGDADGVESNAGQTASPTWQGRGGASSSRYRVAVHYLTSYEHMGRAAVSCEEGCRCEPQVIDAHVHTRESVVRRFELKLSMQPATKAHANATCALRFEVVKGSSSGEHAFKLTRLVVSQAMGQLADEPGGEPA